MMIFRSAAAVGLGIELVTHLSESGSVQSLGYHPLPLMGVVFGIAFLLMEGHESISAFMERFRHVHKDRDESNLKDDE
jgi:hypothetical protein